MMVPPTTLRYDTITVTKMKSYDAQFLYASGGHVIVREDLVVVNPHVVHAAVFLNISEIEVFTEEEWNKHD